jgi:hypothetical protein
MKAPRDQGALAALAVWFGVSTERSYRRCTKVKESPGAAPGARRRTSRRNARRPDTIPKRQSGKARIA